MTKTTTGAHRAISHSSWQTTTPKIVKTKHDEITIRDLSQKFALLSISCFIGSFEATSPYVKKGENKQGVTFFTFGNMNHPTVYYVVAFIT